MAKVHCISNRGIKHELSDQLLRRIRETTSDAADHILATIKNDSKCMDFQFNRHTTSTNNIFDYLNGGKLHMPEDICPQKFNEELEFWGIPETELESCCFTRYVSYFDNLQVLSVLEEGECKRNTMFEIVATMAGGNGWRSIQARAWSVMEYPTSSFLAKVFLYISNAMVLLSLFLLVSSTHPVFRRKLTKDEWFDYFTSEEEELFDDYWFNDTYHDTSVVLPRHVYVEINAFWYLKMITLAYFTIEIICKLIVFPLQWREFITFLNFIDILALVVMYTSLIVDQVNPKEVYKDSGHDIVYSLQVFRVFRLFRLVRHISGFRILLYTLRASVGDLLVMLLTLCTAVLLFSSLAYFSQDSAFAHIPDAAWWAVVTLTTVGYGDIYPTTVQGRLIASTCAITGVCLLALLIPVLVNNFLLFYSYYFGIERRQNAKKKVLMRKSSVAPK
ncbi:voltage-gated potassium channel [Mytilus galloprovincialis]|uniref:Voltage-gated potassium channel n=2 Tax=Mytilus galloprovincialis TaxID=29158 RepID=A0A8B6D8T1_MYTGA|nr:voltage-gated potassium channel [Mytilus galloprovincialis]